MALPFDADLLRIATFSTMPLKLIPSVLWVVQTFIVVATTGGWSNFLSIVGNIETIWTTIVQSATVLFQLLLFLPVDLWIIYETFYIDDASKTSGWFPWLLRPMSWVIVAYSSIMSVVYVIKSLWTGFIDFQWFSFDNSNFVEEISSILALAPAIVYLFQINAYDPYF